MGSPRLSAVVAAALLAGPAVAQLNSELEMAKIRLGEATILAADAFIAGKPVKASVPEPELREIETIVGSRLFSAFAKNLADAEAVQKDLLPKREQMSQEERDRHAERISAVARALRLPEKLADADLEKAKTAYLPATIIPPGGSPGEDVAVPSAEVSAGMEEGSRKLASNSANAYSRAALEAAAFATRPLEDLPDGAFSGDEPPSRNPGEPQQTAPEAQSLHLRTLAIAEPPAAGQKPSIANSGSGRPLSEDEKSDARSIFRDKIDYDEVRIITGKDMTLWGKILTWWKPDAAVTWGNTIYYPNDEGGNSLYHPEKDDGRNWNMHEMTHVYQYQTGGWSYVLKSAWQQLTKGDDAYNYKILPAKPFKQYGVEQQGDIIHDYFSGSKSLSPEDRDNVKKMLREEGLLE